MVKAIRADSGWRVPAAVIRVRLAVQPQVGLRWSNSARLALTDSTSAAVRLVEVEQHADLLLIAGAADWVENLVRQLRERGDAMPIVVLNDRLQNGENARILDAGADDCLACPFDSAELRARVRAIMRRRSGDLTRDLEIGADFETLRIRVRDVDARVSRKQFEIFLLLAERREHWVHSDEIIAAVSGTHHDPASSVVRVQIHALRKAVGAARECIRCDGHKSYMLSLATG